MRAFTTSLASFEIKVLVAFGAAMLVVTGLATTTWKMAGDAAEAARMVAHTHAVLNELARIRNATLQTEYSTQSFRISGDPSRLTERDAAMAVRESLLSQLKEQAVGNAHLLALWEQLREVINKRIGLSKKIEQLRKTEGAAAADAFVASAPLQETRARTYQILDAMDAEVSQLLQRHSDSQLRAQNIFAAGGALMSFILLGLLTATYVLMRRQLRQTMDSQRALAESTRQHHEQLEQRVTERTAALRESEDHLRSVINNLPALIAYVDANQRYVYANAQYVRRFAPERSDITGRTVREILGDVRYATAAPMIADVLQGNPRSYDWQPFSGTWQLVSYVPKPDGQQILGYYVLIADITERKHSEEKIQLLNTDLERYARTLKTLSDGNRAMLRAGDEQDLLDSMCRAIVGAGAYPAVAVWYKNDDESQSLTPMAGEGYPAGLAALNQLKVTWADNEKGRGAVGKSIRTGQTHSVADMLADPNYAPWREALTGIACVVACPLKVGSEVIGTLAIYGAEPNSINTEEEALLTELADDLAFGISTLRARLAQHHTQEALYRLMRYDTLTGLPNETQFTGYLSAAIETGTEFHEPFAVLQININRLNEINDALGFAHGDELLRAFGARIVGTVMGVALIARLRGDEFAVLLPECDADGAIEVVKQITAALSAPFPIADIALDVSTSIGVVLYPEHGATPHDLYRHVDSAVNQAKRKGAGHFIFDPAQSKEQSRRLSVAGELRRAIENGDLLLYLQPKVEMASGKVCGAEGLVRWKHAERGLVPPLNSLAWQNTQG